MQNYASEVTFQENGRWNVCFSAHSGITDNFSFLLILCWPLLIFYNIHLFYLKENIVKKGSTVCQCGQKPGLLNLIILEPCICFSTYKYLSVSRISQFPQSLCIVCSSCWNAFTCLQALSSPLGFSHPLYLCLPMTSFTKGLSASNKNPHLVHLLYKLML